MRNCRVYLKDNFDAIYIANYIGHKIRYYGYSEFYSMSRTYYIQNKNISYISIDREVITDGKET